MTEPLVVILGTVTRADVGRVGGKAGTLGELLQAGYRVPAGFVVTAAAFRRWLEGGAGQHQLPSEVEAAIESALNGFSGKLAVRSSGVAEDSAEASYAGLYETLLGVVGAKATLEAVAACFLSAFSGRVEAYRPGDTDEMAVLVQRQVEADVAGVAFTANPVSGARDEVLINSVRGVGDRLVSGMSDPDEWVVRAGEARCLSDREGSLDAELALKIADIASSVEALLGGPQDMEWAVNAREVYVLQARPITALPEVVEWRSALPGGWVRNFRLGEWIGEPLTPLFDTWLLARLEQAFSDQYQDWFGFRLPPPHHQTVNGWYFGALLPTPRSLGGWAKMIAGMLARLIRDPRRMSAAFPPLAGIGMDIFVREWRGHFLPRYEAAVEMAQSRTLHADPSSLVEIVDEVAEAAGRYFASLTVVGGYGWKTELPLARFYREHLAATLGGSHQTVLSGLSPTSLSPHSVQGLDWHRRTLGEMTQSWANPAVEIEVELRRRRTDAEQSAKALLMGKPKLAAEFERLLRKAQQAAMLRDEHVSQFTLAWPLLRDAVMRIGKALETSGALTEASDVFFLTYQEMTAALAAPTGEPIAERVEARRGQWERQGRLQAPGVIGKIPRPVQAMFAQAEVARSGGVPQGALIGQPASPGRATAVARVIRTLDQSARLGEGEVLVAPLTTPAWTPLFRRAAAVVTDVGSVIAHASLVAREYGIPAVVGTSNGTSRIRDGAVVTVDGGAGYVELMVD